MWNFLKKHVGEIAFAVAVAVCALFLIHTAALGAEYSSATNAQAADRAEFYSLRETSRIIDKCDDLKRQVKSFASAFKNSSEADAADRIREEYLSEEKDESIVDIIRFKGDKFYDWNDVELEPYAELKEIARIEETELSRVFQYDNRIMSIGAAARVENSPAMDGIILVFDRERVSLTETSDEAAEDCLSLSEFALLLKYDGRIIDKKVNSSVFTIGNDPVQNGLLKNMFSNESLSDKAVAAITGGETTSFVFDNGGENYVLTINSLGAENGSLSLLAAYKVGTVYGTGYETANGIWSSLIGLAAVTAVAIAATLINLSLSRHRAYLLDSYDNSLNCSTPKKFEKDVEAVVKRHKGSSFALVSLKVINFGFVSEKFGDDASEDLAKFCSGNIRRNLYVEEAFSYAGDGEFLLLLHFRDRQAFTERLNATYLRLSAFDGLGEDYKVSVAFAVYEIEKDVKLSVKGMLDKLRMVKKASTANIGSFSINFYEDIIHEDYVKKAEIEGRMENALENSEFHLFYQPKYNLRTKNMDGSEILIRWYDPKIERYRTPAEFLPVFEEDGFISKLDRFVFFKACENISKRVAEGKTSYPVSVNVSRVTAIQPDFTDYYIRIKNKFNIADGFITLEFTESFAYENYEFLAGVVNKLHANGMLCSIDDFGTGYSSYNILKTIEMDEIKLDKFFLSKGIDPERDQTLLKSVIGMVKKLGMKVTQEGVETRDDLLRLEELGCDVIQGYYFAKPMKYVDYCEFIEKNFIKK